MSHDLHRCTHALQRSLLRRSLAASVHLGHTTAREPPLEPAEEDTAVLDLSGVRGRLGLLAQARNLLFPLGGVLDGLFLAELVGLGLAVLLDAGPVAGGGRADV